MRCALIPADHGNRKRPPFRTAFLLPALFCLISLSAIYQFSLPWQELAQEREDAFQPMVVVRFLTPLLCVAALNDVVL